jgi:hypothetical protein
MATQKHLDCEGESCLLFTKKCSPHVSLTCLVFFTCHEWVPPDRLRYGYPTSIFDNDMVLLTTRHVS